MNDLREAMMEIEEARGGIDHSDLRTQLESISASLQEMLDTEDDEKTDAEVAFGDADFGGAQPSGDNLLELERNLNKLVETTEREDVRSHLETAHAKIADYRTQVNDDG